MLFLNRLFFILLSIGVVLSSCSDDDSIEPRLLPLEEHRANLSTVGVGGFNLSYRDYGDPNSEKTIILLHGVPTSSFMYRNVGGELADKTNFRVIALDLLGFGDSDKPAIGAHYTFANQAQRVYDFASALGIENFVLGVHDTGGMVFWMMMLDSEISRVEGVLITDTALDLDGFVPPMFVLPIITGEQTPTEVWGPLDNDPALAEREITGFIQGGLFDPTSITEEELQGYIIPVQESSEVFITSFEDFGNVFALTAEVKAAMAAFNGPVAILWGEGDNYINADITPGQIQADFNVPDDMVLILENTGHYLHEENPTAVVDFASDFLNNNF